MQKDVILNSPSIDSSLMFPKFLIIQFFFIANFDYAWGKKVGFTPAPGIN